MKALITSDWHVGVRGDSETYHNIFINWMENFLIPTIKEEEVDYLFILADFFNNRNTINTKTICIAIDAMQNIFVEFPDLKVILDTGNHDIYHKNSLEISSLNMFENMHDNFEIVKKIKRFSINGKDLVMCPWIINSDDADELFSKPADYCFGHFEINGFEMVSGITERNGLNPSKFRDTFGKTFSGHFHIRQESEGILYVGNPYHMNKNDCGNEKGVYILDFKNDKLKFVLNKISPQYKKVLLSQIKNKTVKGSDLTNNFVQLIIDDVCTEKYLTKLQEKINKKDALTLEIEGFNDEEIEMPDAVETNLSDPLDYLNEFINETEFSSDIDKHDLIKLSKEIHIEISL